MKKNIQAGWVLGLAAILALLTCIITAPARASDPFYSPSPLITQYVKVNDSTNATVSLITGVANQTIKVYKYKVSLASSDTVYLKCGSSGQTTANTYLGATGGLNDMIYPLAFQCQPGEGLSLIKGNATTGSGTEVFYNQN